MKKKIYWLAIPVFFVFLFGCYRHSTVQTESPSKRLFSTICAEEYQVWNDLLRFNNAVPVREIIVITDQTSSIERLFEYLGEKEKDKALAELCLDEKTYQEILEDAQKKDSAKLKRKFNLAKYFLLSEKKKDQIFKGSGNGWDYFYSKYPDSGGITSFSRVGFNLKKDKALVFVGHQAHYMAGAGLYYLLSKENNVWKIKGRRLIWIS